MNRFNIIFENAVRLHDLTIGHILSEEDDKTVEVLNKMSIPSNWIRNNYNDFINSLNKSSRPGFLTHYTPEELKQKGVQTFQLNGYNIGYALDKQEDGNVDIICVHNNEPQVHNIADVLLQQAKNNGGTQLDHFDGKLSDIYSRNGFEEYDRAKWNDEYAPYDWDYEKYGRPDVVFRRINQNKFNEWIDKVKTFEQRLNRIPRQ